MFWGRRKKNVEQSVSNMIDKIYTMEQSSICSIEAILTILSDVLGFESFIIWDCKRTWVDPGKDYKLYKVVANTTLQIWFKNKTESQD